MNLNNFYNNIIIFYDKNKFYNFINIFFNFQKLNIIDVNFIKC